MSVAFRSTKSSNLLVAVADLNGDARMDFLGTTGSGPSTGFPLVELGNGDGTFQPITYPAPGSYQPPPASVVVAAPDFDGDGLADTLTSQAGFLSLALAQPAGGFRTQQILLPQSYDAVLALTVSDLNADGRPDIIANISSNPSGRVITQSYYKVVLLNLGPSAAITGSLADQAITDQESTRPFAAIQITPEDAASEVLSLSLTMDSGAKGRFSNLAGGSYDATTGVYTLSGTAAELTAALTGLVFTPTENRVAPGATEKTSFAIAVTDAQARTVSDTLSSVIASSVNDAPRITGGIAAQAMTEEQTIRPFADLDITDPDSPAQTLTLTVKLDDPSKGSLANGAVVYHPPGGGDPLFPGSYDAANGTYTATGAASAVSTYLANLVFRPAADHAGFGSEVRTGFTVTVSDGLAPPSSSTVASVLTTINILDDAPADFFGQGTSDILLQNTRTGACYIWKADGIAISGGGFAGWAPGAAWQAQGTGDFNGDGKADILLQHAGTGNFFIFLMAGIGLVGGGKVGPDLPGPEWVGRGIGDFNGDAKSDIVFQNALTGQVYLWDLRGTAIIGGGPAGTPVGAEWHVAATGDFDGDGRSDLVFQNSQTGACYLWQMNDTAVVEHGTIGWVPGAAWQVRGAGDFNGDGKSDILLQHAGTGDCYLWMTNGKSLIGGGPVGWTPGPAWKAEFIGDFNNDGRSDILLQNADTGACYMWQLDGVALTGGGTMGWTPGAEWLAIG